MPSTSDPLTSEALTPPNSGSHAADAACSQDAVGADGGGVSWTDAGSGGGDAGLSDAGLGEAGLPTITWGDPVALFTAGDIGHPGGDNNPGVVSIDDTQFDWFFVSWDGQYMSALRGPSTQPNQTNRKTVNDSYASWINVNDLLPYPWIVGTYRDDDTGTVYALIHLEFRQTDGDINWRSRLAIATSTDGGLSWDAQGYIITQQNECMCGETTNIGGSGIVVRNGYMYTWYNDSGQTAVARAALSDVLAGVTTNWFKYYNGDFSEPGLGGRFTPLNQPVGWTSSISFNTYLNQFMVAMWSPLALFFSKDGITWSNNPIEVTPDDGGTHWYTVITSPGYKEGTSGQSFDVTYWDVTQPTQSANDTRMLRRFTIQ
jgi:hypothetical protein